MQDGPPTTKCLGTKFVQDFDRFYKQSYLEKQRDAARCDLAERQKKASGVQHFHRPGTAIPSSTEEVFIIIYIFDFSADNFSYSKVRTDFSLPKRGEDLIENLNIKLKPVKRTQRKLELCAAEGGA